LKVTLRLYASHENGQALLSKDLELALAPFVGMVVEGMTSQGAMTGVLDVHPLLMPPDKPNALRLPVVQIAISAQKGDVALQLASLSYRQGVVDQKLSWTEFLAMLARDFPGWQVQPGSVATHAPSQVTRSVPIAAAPIAEVPSPDVPSPDVPSPDVPSPDVPSPVGDAASRNASWRRGLLPALDIVAGRTPCPMCGALADLWPSSATWTCPSCHAYWSVARDDMAPQDGD
jgi:hypothetical protein